MNELASCWTLDAFQQKDPALFRQVWFPSSLQNNISENLPRPSYSGWHSHLRGIDQPTCQDVPRNVRLKGYIYRKQKATAPYSRRCTKFHLLRCEDMMSCAALGCPHLEETAAIRCTFYFAHLRRLHPKKMIVSDRRISPQLGPTGCPED